MPSSVKKWLFTDWVLLFALVLVGGFHEYVSCTLSAAMCVYLLRRLAAGTLRIRKSLFSAANLAVCLGYGVTCLWAIDRGMALIGFLKFLPLGLYLLCLWQEEHEGAMQTLLPYLGVAMAAISAVCMQFPSLERLFAVAGRLGGFFQYPNTFALFLLVCELLVLKKENKKIWDYGIILALVAGLLYTGSRAVFVVFALANVAMLFAVSKKNLRWALLAVLAAALVLAAVLLLTDSAVLQRLLSISLTESTFAGRILYYLDALPLLLKYPFGMGYMGYYYVQNSIQTGVYSIMYIHNDLLQLLLDIGWIPGLLLVGAILRWFTRKQIPLTDKIIVGAVLLHSLFDFNLQYMGMLLLLTLLMERHGEGKQVEVKTTGILKTSVTVAMALSLYMGVSLLLPSWGMNALADVLYPYNTQNKLVLLQRAENVETAGKLADSILKQNTHYYAPYSVKAKQSYTQGDVTALIRYKRAVFERKPFDHTEYWEYCDMLIACIGLYEQAGDTKSVEYCKNELLAVKNMLESNRDRLSPLGKIIRDQPTTELSEEHRQYIEANCR